ncbi:death-associated protein kinase related-like [Hydractinia symbiolongicarpus]|uniref:death-associated protein kinase related-like n=1 Tax=Hydractinia symbiolongicarpus TaxID=13093 RepID=UPI00254A4E34|nr:death-associated protein kinase related-like [Hydractinia symbiolongicarpus]
MQHIEDLVNKTESYDKHYDVLNELGRGRFAVVKKCTCKKTGKHYAAKVIKKSRTNSHGRSGREQLLLEIDILNQSNHPKMVRLYNVFETRTEMQLILEFAAGGDLHRHCIEGDVARTEKEICYLIRQICEAVRYLHDQNIVHLDLKPDNILLAKHSEVFPEIRLIDFGLSRRLDVPYSQFDIVGTPEYVAPEVLAYEPIDYGSDMWSVGVVTYVLLSGISPFAGDDVMETYSNIGMVEYDFDCEEFDDISDDAIDFIEKLLIRQPKKRMSACEALEHSWLKQLEGGLTAEDVIQAQHIQLEKPEDVVISPLVEDEYPSSSESETPLEKSTEILKDKTSDSVASDKKEEKNEKETNIDTAAENETSFVDKSEPGPVGEDEPNSVNENESTSVSGNESTSVIEKAPSSVSNSKPSPVANSETDAKITSEAKENIDDNKSKNEKTIPKEAKKSKEMEKKEVSKENNKEAENKKKILEDEENKKEVLEEEETQEDKDGKMEVERDSVQHVDKTTPHTSEPKVGKIEKVTKKTEIVEEKKPVVTSSDKSLHKNTVKPISTGMPKLTALEKRKQAFELAAKADSVKNNRTPNRFERPSSGRTSSSSSTSSTPSRTESPTKLTGRNSQNGSNKSSAESSPVIARKEDVHRSASPTTTPAVGSPARLRKEGNNREGAKSPAGKSNLHNTSVRGKIPGGIAAKMAGKFSNMAESTPGRSSPKPMFVKRNSMEKMSKPTTPTESGEKHLPGTSEKQESQVKEELPKTKKTHSKEEDASKVEKSESNKKTESPKIVQSKTPTHTNSSASSAADIKNNNDTKTEDQTNKQPSALPKDLKVSMTLGGGSMSPSGKKLTVGKLVSSASKKQQEQDEKNDEAEEKDRNSSEPPPMKLQMGKGGSVKMKLGIGRPNKKPETNGDDIRAPKLKELRGKSTSLSRRRADSSPNSPRKNYRRLYVTKVRNSKLYDPDFNIMNSEAAKIMQRVDNDVLQVELRLTSTDLKLLP